MSYKVNDKIMSKYDKTPYTITNIRTELTHCYRCRHHILDCEIGFADYEIDHEATKLLEVKP